MVLNHRWKTMGNDEFGKYINKMYQTAVGGGYRPSNLGSARNQAIEDLLKSLTEDVDKYCNEIDQRPNKKHKPKFTDEEFNKTCEELGLVEDNDVRYR
jgi:hypothetical protein